MPVIGLLRPPFALRPNPREVADIFEVSLAHILAPHNHCRVSHVRDGCRRLYYTIGHGDRLIWGATAAILVGLSRLLFDEEDGKT